MSIDKKKLMKKNIMELLIYYQKLEIFYSQFTLEGQISVIIFSDISIGLFDGLSIKQLFIGKYLNRYQFAKNQLSFLVLSRQTIRILIVKKHTEKNFFIYSVVQKILQFKSQKMKQLSNMSGQASPSPLVEHDEPSQLSLNPSFVYKPGQSSPSTFQGVNPNQKKRLKFDQIFEQDMADNNNKLPQVESQQQIEIEFHLSNCLKAISDFFKTNAYRYIYVTVLMLFLINCTLESAQISDTVHKITEWIDLGFQIFFSIALLMKLTHFQDQRVFWLVLDLITNLSSYLAFGLCNYPQPVRYLKAIKILRLLMIVNESDYLQVPAAKLIYSLSSVGKILFPAALFIYFYAIIGLYSFRDYEYTKCRDPSNKLLSSNWTVYEDSIFLCGQKKCPIVNGIQYECINPIDYGVEPNQNEVMNIIQGNGLMRYNNIFYALFSTFKQTFITGSSRLMILGKQVTNYFYVLVYYLSFVYLLAYIYLNIFYGLMITNEEEAVDNRRKSSFELKLYTKRNINTQDVENKEEGQQNQKNLNTNQKPSHSMIEPKKTNKTTLKKAITTKIDNIKEIPQSEKSQKSEKSELEEVIDLKPKIILTPNQHRKNQSPSNQFQSPQKQQKNVQQLTERQLTLLNYGQIMKKYFLINHIVVILCSINILIDYEGQTHSVKLIVDSIDFAFFWVYFIEMIFRIIVHMRYIPDEPFDKVFKLDFILFCLCTCGLTYQVVTAQSLQHFIMASDNPSKILRTLKYLRIFILISSTPYFNEARIIFNSTLEAVSSVKSLLTLWLLVLVIFSIMGYHMFNGKTKVNQSGDLDLINGQPQKVGFEGIIDSLIYTVFIFYNEEWDWFLFEQYVSRQFLIVIWQLIVLVIGLQVLSKYFMASLMKELGEKLNQEDELVKYEEENENQLAEILQQDSNLEKMNSSNDKKQSSYQFTLKLKPKQLTAEPQMTKKTSQEKMKRRSRMSINCNNGVLEIKELTSSIEAKKKRTQHESMMRDIIFRDSNSTSRHSHLNNINKIKPSDNEVHFKETLHQSSFFQETRMSLFTLLKSRVYIFIKVLFILVSVVCTLIMNPHEDPNSSRTQTFTKIWYVTMAFFFLEILLSMFAFGVFREKTGYLRNAINWIYILVMIIQIISIIPGLIENAHLQSLLSFRVLRIFVFIELKYEADSDMRLTMVAFWKLLPKVINLLAITIIMYGLFAIILVKLYKDDFYYCDGHNSSATILTDKDCMSWGGSWIKRRMNVSSIFNSLIYLFLLATTEGWSVQVIESASLTGKGNQPEYGNSIWMEYFFSVFFFFGNMIMLNIFIGLSVNNFQKIKSQVTGLARLSKDSKMWFSIKNTIHRLKPTMKDSPPQNIISKKVHMFMNSTAYKIITTILLILFLVNMSFYTTNMTESKQMVLEAILDSFMGIFILEYVLLWIANGTRAVKKRIFWFSTISAIYYVTLIALSHTIQIEPKLYRILHGIAVCLISIRCFAILNQIEFVRKMINSLVSIFPQTSNIWLLIFIVLFSYAVIGIYFFGYLKISPELNQFDQNYTDLPSAMYALIKFSTLESPMIQIIDSTAEIQPNSVCYDMYSYQDFLKHGRMGCGRPAAGYIFFLSFQLIYTMILLSTLMAVIVDAYSEVRREQESMVNKFQLEQVQKQWQNFDPEATGYISYRDFWIFAAKLVNIYKVNKEQLLSHETKQSFLKSLEIPIYEDQSGVLSFQFHEVVQALTRIVVKQKMRPDWNTNEADQVFKNHHRNISNIKTFRKSAYDSSHVLTLIILKSGLKVWKRKAVGVVENHQNFQKLFQMAKKQKDKSDSSNHQINGQSAQNNIEVKPQTKQAHQQPKQVPMTKKNSFINKSLTKDQSNPTHHPSSFNMNLLKSSRDPVSIERNQKILMVETSPRAGDKDACDLEEIK